MPAIVWEHLDPVTMSRLGVDLIREEFPRRQLDTSGSKEDLIQRLEVDIRQQPEATPPPDFNASASTCAPTLTLDEARVQNLALLFHQIPCAAAKVPTLPDLSSSITQFDGSHSPRANVWLDDMRRVQQLASSDDATTRLIAASKLDGTARNWRHAFGNRHATWSKWSAVLKDNFGTKLTNIDGRRRL